MKKMLLCLLLWPGLVKAQTKGKPPVKSIVKPAAGGALKESVGRGQLLYKAYCLACHQVDGSGVGTLNPPLVKEWAGGDKKRIVQMILKSSIGKVTVDGDKFSNTMPAQPFLTDQQLADVLTYVRNGFGFKASAVTAAEVKAIRAKTK